MTFRTPILHCRRLLFMLALSLPGLAASAPFTHTWFARDLVKTDGETAELRDEKGKVVKRLEVKQLVYIYAAMQSIKEAAETEAELFIIDGDQPNAFATVARFYPVEEGAEGGKTTDVLIGRPTAGEKKPADDSKGVDVNVVAINFAMLDMLMMDVDMVAALIGHELAHLKLKHGEDAQARRSSIDMQSAAATRYSRDNEREADYLGTIWAVEAGFDPHGAVRLQELLYKHNRFKGGTFVGSHPSSTERIAILKGLARRLSGQSS